MADREPTAAEVDEAQRVEGYLACISQYDREFEKWAKRSEKICKRYRDDNRVASSGSSVKFNILWSNVQTLVPATFSRLPQPDVSRRFRDNDPVGRVAALLLERALEFEVQHYPDYAASMRQSVQDRFLGGRGTTWVRYEPHFKAMSEQLPTDGLEITEDIDKPQEELDYECSPCDYIHPKDFGHAVARTWEEVTKVWRIVYLYEDAVRERFGDDIAASIPYDSSPDKKDKYIGANLPKQAKIYEIWDKETKTALWISKSLGKIIDERDDPLKLSEFWPCPRPLYATITNETLIPVPDFVLYQDQADELDTLSDRIDGLIKALQVKGVHDSSVPELSRLFTEGTNTDLIPVKNWQAFAEKKGLGGAIDLVDLTPFANALKEAYLAMGTIKEYVYEITGIADIIRGQGDASETLGAQQIKKNFVGLRLKTMQGDVAIFAADLLRIKAQIICSKYAPETIVKISAADQLSQADQQYITPALALLIGPERMQNPEAMEGPNPLRSFRIEVATDSLVQMDEQQEKTDRMEFLKAAGSFLKDALPMAQQSPQAAPLIVQMLKFGVTGFKVGKTIEGDFDQALDQLKALAQQPQQPRPDPDMLKIQAQSQADAAALQQQGQLEQMKAQLAQQQAERDAAYQYQLAEAESQRQMQLEQWKQQQQAAQVQHQNELEAQRDTLKMQLDAAAAQRENEMKNELELSKQAFERWKAQLDAETKISVAELAAQTTLQTAQLSAARAEATGGAVPKSAGEAKAPSVTINMPSTRRTIKKNPDGSYTSEDMPADTP